MAVTADLQHGRPPPHTQLQRLRDVRHLLGHPAASDGQGVRSKAEAALLHLLSCPAFLADGSGRGGGHRLEPTARRSRRPAVSREQN